MAVHAFRSHLAWYAHGLYGASAFRAKVNAADTAKQVEDAVEQFFLGAAMDAGAFEAEQELDYRTALG
jgi:tRNA-dihydrouridine synthase